MKGIERYIESLRWVHSEPVGLQATISVAILHDFQLEI